MVALDEGDVAPPALRTALIIAGVSQRFVPQVYGLTRSGRDHQRLIFWLMNGSLVLNMISTAVMIRLGHVYGNQMVNVQPTNHKLTERARRIIRQTTGVSSERAAELLTESGNSVRAAIIMEKVKVSRTEAERLLARAGGRIREALASFGQV